MDWKRIEQHLAVRAAGDNRIPEVVRSRAVLTRLRRHLRKRAKRLRAMFKGPTPIRDTAQYGQMRKALKQGHRIIAFDAEWQYQWPHQITELGVAIYHNGHTEMHNIRVRAGGGKTDPRTRFMTDDQAKRWLQGIFDGAQLLVGHAIRNDREKMHEWGWALPEVSILPCVDTEKWSRMLNEQEKNSQKLTTFCRNHGVEILKAHVAGNDALMTLNVALKLAQGEQDVLEEERDGTQGTALGIAELSCAAGTVGA